MKLLIYWITIGKVLYFNSIVSNQTEGKRPLKPEFKSTHFTNLRPLEVTVYNSNDKSKKTVLISYFQTIGHLRQRIAE